MNALPPTERFLRLLHAAPDVLAAVDGLLSSVPGSSPTGSLQPGSFRTGSFQTGTGSAKPVVAEDWAAEVLQELRQQRFNAACRGFRTQRITLVTTLLDTVIAFACAQSTRGLRSLQGVFGRRLQPNEFVDTYLPPGIAFAKLPNREPERIRCWEPAKAT